MPDGKDPELDFYRHREWKPGATAAPVAQPVRVMNSDASPVTAEAGASSPWNAAGTWEEKGKKQWAVDAFQRLLVGLEQECEGGKVAVTGVVASGDASITFTRGKKKWPYDFKLEFTIEGPDGMKCEVVIPDFACDECAPYEMDFTWKGDSRNEAAKAAVGATSKKVNASEGLMYLVHQALEKWFEEFKASC
eukprot:TRINITY_DN4561_c0_g1_i2.p2 TRINITY_DN4561_c0_g1~~TRINITY_DN4561_c0_g1_i2.p2  ORF type:complete len:192 (+),score=85.48 TRINITY_DN4561_c0_g1_i2:43-618(+)